MIGCAGRTSTLIPEHTPMKFPFCRKLLQTRINAMAKRLEERTHEIQKNEENVFMPKKVYKKSL